MRYIPLYTGTVSNTQRRTGMIAHIPGVRLRGILLCDYEYNICAASILSVHTVMCVLCLFVSFILMIKCFGTMTVPLGYVGRILAVLLL